MIEPGTPYSALLARLAHDPSLPLLTDVDLTTGDRVELSVSSAANGAAKAAHLVAGVAAELGRPPTIALDLPLHWQVVTFALGAWASGARLVAGGAEPDEEVDAVLLGPGALAHPPDDLPDTVWATRLHPFGLPLTPAPAYPVEDLTSALRQQPDAPPPDRGASDAVCLVVPGAPAPASTMADLMARARGLAVGLDPDDRILTTLPLTTADGWVAACRPAVPGRALRGARPRRRPGRRQPYPPGAAPTPWSGCAPPSVWLPPAASTCPGSHSLA